jgi:aminoglycoside phosphotransferase (APT) family kinase protein
MRAGLALESAAGRRQKIEVAQAMNTPRSVEAAPAKLDADSARTALVAAASQAGLDATDAELVRIGSNAVFRFRGSPVIGRLAPSEDRLESAKREIAVARWLLDAGVPAVRALGIPQPLVSEGRVVTFWESASDDVKYGTTVELGALLRQLHTLTPPLPLPTYDPIARAYGRLRTFTGKDKDFLAERCEALREDYSQLAFELEPGVIHGDANVGNVIRDRSNRALLADLDGFSIGPREWDLILTALYYERFGWHTAAEYRGLVESYGFDVMAWSGYPVMRDVRELLMVVWLADKSMSDEAAAAELTTRVRALKTGGSRRDWQPF